MFELARKHSDSPLLSIINTDILLMPDFVKWAQRARQELRRFVLMGQRWDVNVRRDLEFFHGDSQELLRMIKEEGRLHPRGGSDYFLFPRECYASVPDFAIGRAGWDNWMIYEARQRGWHAVDATGAIQIIHQDHDYSHLPGSQAHYRLPETGENIRLAGGRRTIFRLDDCNYCIRNEQFYKIPLTFERFMRGIEVFPLIKLHSFALTNLFYALFHPRKAYGEFKRRIKKD